MEGVVIVNLDFYNGKRILVTGHTGFKGSWLCEVLLSAGAEVTGYALEPATSPNLFDLLELENRMDSVIGDIRNYELLVNTFLKVKPEIVFHLAAQPLVRESYLNPVNTFETNVMGTVNLLEAIRKCDSIKSVINITTDKVYENKEWHWGYRENENLCGLDPYSNSKSCSELVTFSYKQSFFIGKTSPAISTARSGNVIGGGDFSENRIIPDCVRAALNGEDIIVRNQSSTRPYQHVLECLSGYLLLAEKQYNNKNQFEGAYNFGPEDRDCIETGRLVTLFCDAWKDDVKWIHRPDNGPHEANYLKLDCSKAKGILDWKPNWGIHKAIEATVEWSKALQASEDMREITTNQIKNYFYD